MPSLETWSSKKEVLALNAGSNTIAYKYDNTDKGFVNLDYIDVQGASVTGRREIEEGNISIYPNPIQNNQLNVEFLQTVGENMTLSLYNSSGTKVYTSALNNSGVNQMQLPANFPRGIYILETTNSVLKHHRKVVVQ